MKTQGAKQLVIKVAMLQVYAMMGFFISSCGLNGTNSTNTSCSSGTAQIQVTEGQIRRQCGCTETGNVAFGSGQSLQCTVSAGTRLYINFAGITTNHQIVVSGVASTAVRGASNSVQTDVILLNNTGTYTFQDFYYPTLGGSLIVN